MKSSRRSETPLQVLALGGALGLALLAGCGGSGGSGGGSGSLAVVNTTFGLDPFSGGFGSQGSNGQPPSMPQNQCIEFTFNAILDKNSASTESIIVQEIDLSVTPPVPKGDAGVNFRVNGSKLQVCPLITFTQTNVSFGYNPLSAYQIVFQVPPSSPVVSSGDGRPLRAQSSGPYIFRTTDVIFDSVAGPPQPTIRLRSSAGALLGTTAVPFKPVPTIEIEFNEPVIPTTVISDPNNGASTSLHVDLDKDGDPNTAGDRITIPGRFTLTQDQDSALVKWTSLLTELPTSPAGSTYVVRVDGTISDIAGNSKVKQTNDPSAGDELPFITAPGPVTGSADPVIEEFDTLTNEDLVTSASWGRAVPGLLTSGVGGGTGADGVFDPLDPSFPPAHLAAQILNDPLTSTTTIFTDDQSNGTPFDYEFLSIDIPIGWTVRPEGPFPLQILCSGTMIVRGTLDLSGQDGELYAEGQLAAGLPGVGSLGGATGGLGGSATDGFGGSVSFPDSSSPSNADLGFVPGGPANACISGRATALSAFTLTDTNLSVNLSNVLPDPTVVDVWVQPNVGADDYRFERFHNAFLVESISGTPGNQVITIVSDPNDPRYRGPMDTETDNPYLEVGSNGELRAPLLAEAGDPYVIGVLGGFTGSALFDSDLDGVVDDWTVYNGGLGSDPQVVMQTFTTLGRAGGGGGGGSVFTGDTGDDDPTVANGPGLFGGTGGFGADGGLRSPTAQVAGVNGATQLILQQAIFDDGNGQPDTRFVGHLINPQISQGQTFTIASVNSTTTCTISPIQTLAGQTLDLTTVPNLIQNSTVRITPPYTVGGAGGGGSGVHCAGSSKTPKNNTGYPQNDPRRTDGISDADFYDDSNSNFLEDFQEQIFQRPVMVAGAGGGAGGGAGRFVVAREVLVTSTGAILAEGGTGGTSDASGPSQASGAGGGGGGTLFFGVGEGVTVAGGGRISAAGGSGGAAGTGNQGGDGGDGRIRIESRDGNLKPSDFGAGLIPPINSEALGLFPGGGNSLGQSKFLAGGVLAPEYDRILVTYNYTRANGSKVTGAQYIVNSDGSVDPASQLDPPPFVLEVGFTDADPDTGLPIPTNDPLLDPTTSGNELSNFVGKAYIRFRILLDDPSNPAYAQTNVQIDTVVIEVNSTIP